VEPAHGPAPSRLCVRGRERRRRLPARARRDHARGLLCGAQGADQLDPGAFRPGVSKGAAAERPQPDTRTARARAARPDRLQARRSPAAATPQVEDLASGSIYCAILNSIHPGSVPMSKVKVGARTEVDFIHNFKLLQTGFTKKKIDRYVEVDKLIKRSFQYNMEFLQFMKCYWDL
jgi:hypothetical protein